LTDSNAINSKWEATIEKAQWKT